MAGVYIHIPFCKSKCSYCSFYSTCSTKDIERLYRSLLVEIEREREFLANSEPIETLYIGGGTPTIFSVQMLCALIEKVKSVYKVDRFREVTIEANPDDLTPSYLDELSKSECNRLSIGVQSLNDDILKLINRRHSAKEAIDTINRCKEYGFDNITIDLMYGIPSQSIESVISDIQIASKLPINHISAYHLTFEEGSKFFNMLKRGKLSQIDDSESIKIFREVSNALTNLGFDHYEISNFAKNGYRATHNSNYWKSKPYIGFGPSAHSFDGKNTRRWNISSNIKYIDAIESNTCHYESESLTSIDRINEELMTLLRTSEGVNLDYIAQKYGHEYKLEILKSAEPHINSEGFSLEESTLRIDRNNFMISDMLICSLFME